MPDTSPTTSGTAEGHHEAYQVAERIAVGPAGIVYRAVQSGTQREVTFKVLDPEATHPLDSARVTAIKSTVNGVCQRWIAEWIDAYQDADGFVLVFDYKKGIGGNFFPSAERRLSAADGLRLAAQFCEVLQAAELGALPHGDIKPSNVIIWNAPEQGLSVQVLDWGLSLCRAQHPEESLHCMSPERLGGAAPTLAGDFFSVGVTLTFLLTGCYPVQGSAADVIITGWRNFNPASIVNVRPDLGERLCAWLAWLMSLKPEDRPTSVSHAMDALYPAIAASQSAPAAISPSGSLTQAVSTHPRSAPLRAQIATPTRQISVLATAHIQSAVITPTSKPKKTGKRRWMRVCSAIICTVAMLVAASCIWAQQHYGIKWSDLLVGRWERNKLLVVKSEPLVAEAKPVASVRASTEEVLPERAALIKAVVAAAPAKPIAAFQVRDPLVYPKDAKLDGSNGGTGWPGPWRASNVALGIADRKTRVMILGGVVVSSVRREIISFPAVASSGICFLCSITHPGSQGPVLSLGALSPANGSGPAPVLLIPKGDKLIVSIPKITQTVEIASKGTLRLATLWTFKKQTDGKYECTLTVYLNPVLARRNRFIATPALTCVITDFSPPDVIELALESIGTSKLGASISDIRIAPTLLEASK